MFQEQDSVSPQITDTAIRAYEALQMVLAYVTDALVGAAPLSTIFYICLMAWPANMGLH